MPGEWSPFIKKGETGGWGRSRLSRRGGRGRGGNTNITFRHAMFKTVQDIAMALSAESGKKENKKGAQGGDGGRHSHRMFREFPKLVQSSSTC